MRKVTVLLVAISSCIAILLGGCAAHQRDKSWDAHNTYLKLIEKEVGEQSKMPTCSPAANWLQEYTCLSLATPPDPAKLALLRNQKLEYFIQLADHDYARFEHGFNSEHSTIGAVGDFVSLGLTGAGSAIGSVATELSAAATGTQGAQHSIEKNFYDAQTRFVITNRMQSLRKQILAQIKAGELLPAVCPAPVAPTSTSPTAAQCYSLEQGMNDVQEYFNAGSIHRALQDINRGTSEQAKDAEDKLNKVQGKAPILTK